MVLNGKQVEDAVFGAEGLIHEHGEGVTVVVTATITPSEVRIRPGC
jgi:3-hydroxyisobutyrate dehydrogenase-like beta-hydroxyacid dehydrogenase